MIQAVRRWGMIATVALASCGGGGAASTGSSVIVTDGALIAGGSVYDHGLISTTPGPSITLLPNGVAPGTYTTSSTSTVSGMLLVHPDGHTLGTAQVQPTGVAVDDGGKTLFAGTVASSDLGATGTVTFVFATPKALPQIGTATATLLRATLNAAPALMAWLTDVTVLNPFGAQTYAQVNVSPALHLLPMDKLAGHYIDAASGQDLQITPDGSVAGSYTPNCDIAATLSGYDPDTTLFRMTATLAGAGCAAWLQGTHEYLGNLGASESGHVMLNAYAISGSMLATLVFTHSQQLGTY
jgi:hypothetical protein